MNSGHTDVITPSTGIRSFQKEGHTVIWGDALEALESEVKDGSIQLIFADPPYNIGKQFANFLDRWPSDADYAKWCEKWLAICIRKLSPNGSLYVMSSTQCMPYLDLFLRDRVEIISRIVWHYDSSGVQARSKFGSMYEPILFCAKDSKNYIFNSEEIKIEAPTGSRRKLIDYRKAVPTQYSTMKVPGNAWYFPRVRYRMPEYEDHPSQKPMALMERIVLASSNPGDIVLDPFSGTFTTSAAAKKHGRNSIGIELAEEYVKIGLRRLSIQETLDGERLQSLTKNYARKNDMRKLKARNEGQMSLFHDKNQ
ncbi:MAG: adenine-specific DNA-methyltransferase [Gammaproteobacteria bacterium AqS3]|nr:adenine-specific DNA-methyltransferase [Gammaproteobacteria bacterium AqS3]